MTTFTCSTQRPSTNSGLRLRRLGIGILATGLLLAVPASAAADVTAFFGAGHKPKTRAAKGAAVGITLILVGFEIEYSDISENDADGAPRLRTGTVNALVQTPTAGAQLYATAGVGAYRENYRSLQETNTAINIGGGIKLGLLGPLKMRVDYRLFRLRGPALYNTVHRVYAGLNTSF